MKFDVKSDRSDGFDAVDDRGFDEARFSKGRKDALAGFAAAVGHVISKLTFLYADQAPHAFFRRVLTKQTGRHGCFGEARRSLVRMKPVGQRAAHAADSRSR